MIFETKEKDLIVRVDRILEVEKDSNLIFDPDDKTKKKKIFLLGIITKDSQRNLRYENEEKRDSDYENLKSLILAKDKLSERIKALCDVMKNNKIEPGQFVDEKN